MYPIITIFGRPIGTYGLCMLLAVAVAAILAIRRGRRFGICKEDITIVGAMSMGVALICGSLLFCLVTFPAQMLLEKLGSLDIAFFFGSGIVFWGGLLGAIPGCLLGIRIAGCKIADMEQAVVPFLPLGHAIGRIGCLMGGCCYGLPYHGPLAISYPHSLLGLPAEETYFPVQLLEAAVNVGLCFVLLKRAKKRSRNFDLLSDYLALYSLSRFLLEWLRGDKIRGSFWMFSTSQWISLIVLTVYLCRSLFLFIKCRKNAPR